MFKPMALAITFAMIGSLVLTLTLVPVLSALILKPKEEKDTFIVRHAKRPCRCSMGAGAEKGSRQRCDRRPAGVLYADSLPGQGIYARAAGGHHHVPRQQHPSTSLDESIRISQELEKTLKTFPQVESAIAMIGRAEKGDTADVNYMEMLVNLKPREAWPAKTEVKDLATAMREKLEQAAPSSVISATQPIQMRVEELISGVRATLALKLYGEDLTTLDRLSGQLKSVLDTVPGVADLSLEANKGKPQLVVDVNRDAAARYGINATDILDVVQAGIGGKAVSTVIEGTKRFDIQVWLAPEFRSSVQSVGAIPIRTETGALVPLSEVATIELDEGYSFVRREQLQRYAVIQMDVKGRDVDSFVKEASAKIARQVKLPEGYVIEWGGAFENQQRAMTKLAIIVPLTIGLIFILLYTAFNSLTYATLIIANVPFATIGGVVGLFVTGQYLSVPSAIGFIAVFGVAMLNGIVLVTFLNEQREQGMSVRDAVRQGAALRLRPVLMTASIAIFGLVPMLLSSGVGAETQRHWRPWWSVACSRRRP
jgi:cobalt-zinc-cadmium resistance protein CzcA